MDPGRVVWLPDGGFSNQQADAACYYAYGTSACAVYPWGQYMVVFCC